MLVSFLVMKGRYNILEFKHTINDGKEFYLVNIGNNSLLVGLAANLDALQRHLF